jgi:N-acetylglucosamine-6-phosphate deacetylase
MSGYFDLQVNGYGGVDFNSDELSGEDFERALSALRRDGVELFLPTIITDTLEAMCARVRRVVELCERSALAREMIAGVHVEGPFINENDGYRGAHPGDAVRPSNVEEMKRLLEAGDGLLKLVTLAPERDGGFKTISFLVGSGVRVSAGHTDASLDQLKGAIDHGLSLFTHVGNACPMQMHRHDNIIQRALSLSDRLYLMFIADGVHVPLFTLKNFLAITDPDRSIIVTDAIAPAGLGPGRYQFARWDLLIEDDLVARSPDRSHFVGSAITMKRCEANLKKIGLSDEACVKLTRNNPRAAMGISS